MFLIQTQQITEQKLLLSKSLSPNFAVENKSLFIIKGQNPDGSDIGEPL